MLGRPVTSKPSTCAAVKPSTSAERRRWRGSDTRGERASQPAKCELIAVGAKPTHDADRGLREHRVPALRLAGVDVRHVYFDERDGDRRECVANRDARMRIRAGV